MQRPHDRRELKVGAGIVGKNATGFKLVGSAAASSSMQSSIVT